MAYEGGYSSGVGQLSEMQSRGVLDAMRRQAMDQQQRELGAKAAWGPVLHQMMQAGPPQPPQQPGIPPMPGTPAGGPQPSPPGTTSLAPPPQAAPMQPGPAGPIPPMAAPQPVAAAPAAAAPPVPQGPPPPFQGMPSAPPPQAAPGGAIPPPPGPAAAPAAPQGGMARAEQFGLPNILNALKTANVPPQQWGMMLDQLPDPVKNNAAQQIKMLHEQNTALTQWSNMQIKEGQLRDRERQTDIREDAEARRREQGAAALEIKRQKESRLKAQAGAAAGGTANLKSVELIYPRGEDGRPDESKDPIGTRGITKRGQIITLDADGKQTTPGALGGGSAKEAKDTKDKGGGQAAVRASIVKGGVVNALNRLDEIEKAHPTGSTSAFFGTHADNPATRALYGVGQGMQSKATQDIDAKWAAFIDEAIPVFTGGLRGSDAFRRFLIEQAPGPGARPETIKEKMRLFRENINGTSKAFFSKFKDDPSMWAAGTKAEDVQATGAPKNAGAPRPGAVQDGYRFKGGDPAKRESWEKI